MSEWIGKIYGKVKVEKLIARGGMAEVYYGTHVTLNRPVAVKVMLSHLGDDSELKSRFEREAQVLAGLRHPNIVQIYDFDVIEGQPFIVMEYISGPTLSAYLRRVNAQGGRLSLPQTGRLLVMLAAALDHAHEKGVVHRDIKPANVLLTAKSAPVLPGLPLPEDVEPILTDFGLLLLTDASSRSISGTVAGTPAYMSPEQARGERVSYGSDLYSLGVMLYEVLAGRVPFEADSTMGVLMKHIKDTPPPIEGLPVPLQNVLNKVLAKYPEERYANARELARAFLQAAGLTVSDVAPGFSMTPQPGSVNAIPALEARSTLPPTPTPRLKPVKKNKLSTWMLLTPILALEIAAICLVLTGSILWMARDRIFARPVMPVTGQRPLSMSETQAPMSASATPMPLEAHSTDPAKTFGRVRFYNVNAALDEVILTAAGMQPAPEGFQYEAWLTGTETRRSLGILSLDSAGNAEISFVDDQGQNLLARYGNLEITLESNPDPSPNPSGTVAFSSGIPPMALEHIKHLLVAFGDTPNQTGILLGLLQDSTLVEEQTSAMLAAYETQDAKAVKLHAEAIYNLLVGKQGQGYGDLDQDGNVFDPGDGYGMLLNGNQEGYIQGSISHAEFSVAMHDASEPIHHHTPHITISARNVEGWASELRELVKQIIADPLGPNANALIREAAALADRILHGRDLNGNELIDPIEGEGGAKTALEHATYMIDMPILEGADRLPPPVTGAETAEGTPQAPPNYGP